MLTFNVLKAHVLRHFWSEEMKRAGFASPSADFYFTTPFFTLRIANFLCVLKLSSFFIYFAEELLRLKLRKRGFAALVGWQNPSMPDLTQVLNSPTSKRKQPPKQVHPFQSTCSQIDFLKLTI